MINLSGIGRVFVLSSIACCSEGRYVCRQDTPCRKLAASQIVRRCFAVCSRCGEDWRRWSTVSPSKSGKAAIASDRETNFGRSTESFAHMALIDVSSYPGAVVEVPSPAHLRPSQPSGPGLLEWIVLIAIINTTR